jgi:hypothetical protein
MFLRYNRNKVRIGLNQCVWLNESCFYGCFCLVYINWLLDFTLIYLFDLFGLILVY